MITFAAPWLLLALPALPLLWWLLRVTPPQPRRQAFPAAILLRDLPTREETPHRTPWWVLLLRIAAAALLILGLARPVLGPSAAGGSTGTLLLVVDDGWAAGPDWPLRVAIAQAELERAAREGRPAALLGTTPGDGAQAPRVIGPMPAADLAPRLAALRPRPWVPDRAAALAALEAWARTAPGPTQALYLSDALAHGDPAAAEALMARLSALGGLTLARAEERPVRLLLPPRAEGDRLHLALRQSPVGVAGEAGVIAR
ncbi:MAG: BatA domain-containing protein, partial [Rubritepida sp.]|nr:BatA domain-containing protein [Rubritepida sp.]